MVVREVKEDKKQYLNLLLLADEQENMIDRYLTNGTMYVLEDDGVKAKCVVLDVGDGVLEIKNIATAPQFDGKGYGKSIIEFIVKKYRGKYSILLCALLLRTIRFRGLLYFLFTVGLSQILCKQRRVVENRAKIFRAAAA